VLRTLAVQNYRSLRRLVVPLTDLNVVTGPNGSGKSSLYRALRLLADASRNGAVAALAREGGLPATLWAGPEKIGRAVREGRYPVQGTIRTEPVALRLGFGGDDYGYAIDLGLPPPADTAFALDPEIKRECIWTGPVLRPSAVLCDRLGGFVKLRDNDGAWSRPYPVRSCDSMLSEFADPQRAPEVLGLRETIRSWRFYDHVRTDADAPARRSKIGTRHAAAARGPGTLLWHAALPAVGRRAAQPAPGQPARAERARDQPAPRPAPGSGRPDRSHRHPDSGDRRHALTDPGRRTAPVSAERPDRAGRHRAGQGIRRNCRRWPRLTRRAALALAKALGTSPPAISLAEHRVEFGVGPDLPDLLRAAAGGGDLGRPPQRLLA
jgi:energy-coupling factor transporter ATP-binding protein EcfA2